MSLDVYLEVGDKRIEKCPHCDGTGNIDHGRATVHDANITHNLGKMAGEAGIYEHLWRPDEIGITKAVQLVEPLKAGLDRLRAEPEKFRAHNPANGWGNYEGLLRFVVEYLSACKSYPDADVRVSR